jgi:nucleotide-binding universal stress UspA family protein
LPRTNWRGFRSVLCAIDFSEHSRVALRHAALIAARGRARLHVAYANDPLLVAAAAVALHDRHLAERSGRELNAFIDAALSARARAALRVTSHVSIGDPAREIMKAGARTRSDLMVLGTHGNSGVSRLLLGSTTLSVLQRTTVPVLAVPGAGASFAANPPARWPGERIVAALELDARAAADADVAARIAQWFGSSLLLVHVVNHIGAPAWLDADLGAHERIRVARAQQHLDTLAERAAKRVTTEARIVCGSIADEIPAVAATVRAGLLITTLRDRRGWFGARRGSISYHALTHATTPVLACPPDWRPR